MAKQTEKQEGKHEAKLDTTIDRVIVYQRGATITRVGKLELQSGTYDVIIPGLPASVDKDSIRVKGTGEGAILNINVAQQFEEVYSKEDADLAEDEIKKLDQEIAKLREDWAIQENIIAKMVATRGEFFQQFGAWFSAGETSLEKLTALDTSLDAQITKAQETIKGIEDKLEGLVKKREIIDRKLRSIRDRSAVKEFWDVHVILSAEKPSEFALEVAYQIPEAWWQALYDAHVGTGQVDLKIIANTWNNTSEDWNNILLEVSTATLTAITAQKPSPFVLQEYHPYAATANRDMKFKKAAPSKPRMMKEIAGGGMPKDGFAYDLEEAPAPPSEPEAAAPVAEVSDSLGVQTYKLPERISIPSDKTSHPILLTSVTLDCQKKLFWSVVHPEVVVAQDTVTNGELILLPGKVKSYFEGEYVGETTIQAVAPKETFKLGTRLSYEVKVTKKLVDRSRAKQAVKGRLMQRYEYQFQIDNLAKVDVPLKLYDRIPHSNSDKIKVETDFTENPPAKVEMGIVKWKVDLKGIEKKAWKYRYIVNYDKNITITPALP